MSPIISAVIFESKEEIASYIKSYPAARFELAYTMSEAFLAEILPLIEGRVASTHACCPSEAIFPNFASCDPAVLKASTTAMEHTFAFAQEVGASLVVLHPGYVTDWEIPSENGARKRLLADPSFAPYIGIEDGSICRVDYIESDVYQRHATQAKKELQKVAALGEQYGVRLAVENLNPRVAYLFHTPEEMVSLSEHFDLCLDVGHLFIASELYGFDYLEGVKQIVETGKVITAHLHTNRSDGAKNYYRDDHHSIDRHNFPINETLCLLKESGANLVLEVLEEPLYNTHRLITLLEACDATA